MFSPFFFVKDNLLLALLPLPYFFFDFIKLLLVCIIRSIIIYNHLLSKCIL